jgi:hypothetical protein
MPVAAVDPAIGALAAAGAAHGVDLGAHEQLSSHLHHLGQHAAPRVELQVHAQQLGRAQRVGDNHRVLPSDPWTVLEG